MAYKLTENLISKIVYRIENWPDNDLTWLGIIDWCHSKHGVKLSRASLAACEPVKVVYQARKKAISTSKPVLPSVKTFDEAIRRLVTLEEENKQLRQKIDTQRLLIKTIINNACKNGLTQEMLSERLPPINRRG